MSDTTLDWKKTSRSSRKVYVLTNDSFRTPIPKRKEIPSNYGTIKGDIYCGVAFAKGTRVHLAVPQPATLQSNDSQAEDGSKQYPSHLVWIFTVGLAIMVIGAAILLMTIFMDDATFKVAGAFLLALGSVTVVMMLLRGQDLDEQAG